MIVNFILYNADTTDVQNATVTFFGTRIYLTCTFANRTSAMGCIIKFTLSSNRTEQFNITRTEAQLCSMVANQMIAYDRVEVVDWEAGGTVGTLPIRVQPLEAVDEQSFTMSCPLPGKPLPHVLYMRFGRLLSNIVLISLFCRSTSSKCG